MVMLDQIGECFRPANATPVSNTPDFIKALLYFTEGIPERAHLALYALRCCFAHDYSLARLRQVHPRRVHGQVSAVPGGADGDDRGRQPLLLMLPGAVRVVKDRGGVIQRAGQFAELQVVGLSEPGDVVQEVLALDRGDGARQRAGPASWPSR
jgi:hypothetical protein